MAKKEIVWSKRANVEFMETLEYYTQRNSSTQYSLKIIEKTEKYLNALSENELLGRLTENRKTRALVMDVFLIFYEIQDDTINILSFWDNRQNPQNSIKQQ